jgi:Outer membrane protein
LKSEESYLTAKTAADSAYLIRKKYKLTDKQDFFKIDLKKWKAVKRQFKNGDLVNLQIIDTKINILEKDIEAIKSTYSANIALAGTATANVTDIDSSLGFVGLSVSLPIKDGGKRNFQIQEKMIQIEGLKQQKGDIALLHITAFKGLQNFQKIYENRSKLITDQIENSKLITEDIELKLRAGAASVIDLATEKMNFYDLRGQMIALEYKNISEIINFYKAIGHQCDLTELCGQINLVAPAK